MPATPWTHAWHVHTHHCEFLIAQRMSTTFMCRAKAAVPATPWPYAWHVHTHRWIQLVAKRIIQCVHAEPRQQCPPHPGLMHGMCIRCGQQVETDPAAADSVALRCAQSAVFAFAPDECALASAQTLQG